MARGKKSEKKTAKNGANLGFEQTLWQAADKLRGNMDASDYKHVVLGLIFLKYISDAFEERHAALKNEPHANPEDRDEYAAENVYWVPKAARWPKLQAAAKQPGIGKLLDEAMLALEKDNPSLKGVLPKDYARESLDKRRLGELIDLIGTIGLGDKESRSKDILGRVYEYFLGQFAASEGKKGGEFYTAQSVVKLLVEMIEPYKGRVFDPCCGSGGMFVQSEKFAEAHGGRRTDLSIYGQESNQTTWRLCKMNLAIRGIESNIAWNSEGCMHTMYADKPMQRHGLMQAIARVNRVFKDKPGGLVVDYLGLADQLKKALTDYTESGGKGKPVFDQEEAVAKMLEYYEVCSGLFHGFDYSQFKTGKPRERLAVIPPAIEHVLKQEKGKERILKTVTQLSKAFALSVPHDRAIAIRDDVGFFQTVRAAMAKTITTGGRDEEELNLAVRQIVSRSVASDRIIDIFSAAGLKSPEISILSDKFLAEVKGLPQKNLAFEALKKLLNDEIKVRAKSNLVQSRKFSEMLEVSIRKYQNRAIETAQILQELIDLAKQMREADKRGEDLGFTTEELAFYDALEVNDSAVKVLGDDTLKTIARELVDTVHKNTSIDWTVKESVKAKLRSMVKRILRKYGYPPDKQEKATQTVLEQAELLCRDIAA